MRDHCLPHLAPGGLAIGQVELGRLHAERTTSSEREQEKTTTSGREKEGFKKDNVILQIPSQGRVAWGALQEGAQLGQLFFQGHLFFWACQWLFDITEREARSDGDTENTAAKKGSMHLQPATNTRRYTEARTAREEGTERRKGTETRPLDAA